MERLGSARFLPRPSLSLGSLPEAEREVSGNRLLGLLDTYRSAPESLPRETYREIRSRLEGFERRLDEGEGRLSFSGTRFIDGELVCLVFTGLSGGSSYLPPQVNLLVDQEWKVSGGIRFRGLLTELLRPQA